MKSLSKSSLKIKNFIMTEADGDLCFIHLDYPDSVISPLIKSSSSEKPVNIDEIKRLTAKGLDSPIDRTLSWLLILKLYPQDKTKWPSIFNELKTQYFDYVNYTNLQEWHKKQISPQITIDDFGKDFHDMGVIHGDIVRSGRLFFFLPERPILYPQTKADQGDVLFEFQEHLRRLERLLYVFRTFHSGMGYMQGFNEIAIPFYYVILRPFRNHSGHNTENDEISSEMLDTVEVLTFHCFQKIMTNTTLAEFYTTQDQSSIIKHQLNTFENLMKIHLPNCYAAIQSLHIHPVFYCLRWFSLCFAQEHDLPSLLAVWDALISHFQTFVEYLFYVGLGHLKIVEPKINKENYSKTIEALQHINTSGRVKDILSFADECWMKDKNPQPPQPTQKSPFKKKHT